MATLFEQIRILTNPDDPTNPVMAAFRIGREQAEAGWREAQKTFALGKLAVVEKLMEDAKAAKTEAEARYTAQQKIYRAARWESAERKSDAWKASFSPGESGAEVRASAEWGKAIDAEEIGRASCRERV